MHVRLGAALPQPTAQTRPLHLRASYVLWEERRNRAKAKTHVKNASLHDKTTQTPPTTAISENVGAGCV